MRIIAGEDTDFDGEVTFTKGLRVGYLAQEPDLDEEKTVKENVFEGIKEKTDVLLRYYELKEEMEEDPDDLGLKEEFAEVEQQVRHFGFCQMLFGDSFYLHTLMILSSNSSYLIFSDSCQGERGASS